MRRLRGGTSRDDSGAISVIVALTSALLFICAAFAVDLGNAWALKRDVQKQVDVAALSAGYLLPMTTLNRDAIADAVADSLNQNQTLGQAGAIAGSQLLNGHVADGEITFWNDNGSACSNNCTQMKVDAPAADVEMYFSRVMGIDGTSVQRAATVRAMGTLPRSIDMLPFWLPSGCALGPAAADTTGGGGAAASSSPSASPTASPSASPTSGAYDQGLPVGVHSLNGPDFTVAMNASRTISGLNITSVAKQVDRSSIRFYAPDGSRFIEYAATDLKNPASTLTVGDFQIASEVTSTPGDWSIYAVVERNKKVEISASHRVVHVEGAVVPSPSPSAPPVSVPVGCIGQDRGNFGQLDSPRKDLGTGQTNKRLALNIAEGLDHQLVPFVFASGQAPVKECGSQGKGYITGSQLDDVAQDGRNCIQGDTGNDGPAIYDGLIGGIDGHAGRLSVTRPGNQTTCPGRFDRVIGASTINNDVLSCFLRNGATLADLAQPTGVTEAMLDPRVVDSPRFVWLPVVYANDRAQKNFQPILDFVPAFITDETQTSVASADNGVQVNGNSVKTLNVFCFNIEALPVDSRSATTNYNTALRSTVRLVG
ncbi:hypothetical protein [Nocardioides sp.]|uniref:hypothetical protein n=1 Tax=Nocardioides sp. TaxID=35761 RepID=UPI0035649743